MSTSKTQFPVKAIDVRPYKPSDEDQIVNLLNLCFGEWGTLQKWQFLYPQYPTFDEDNVFVMENENDGGLHLRDLVIQRKLKICTASLSDAAIHPRYRGKGLYTKLVEMRLRAAKSNGACLAFSWHLRGAKAYNHNKKIGFIEIKQPPAYMKVIRPEKVLKSGLFDLLIKSQSLREALQDLDSELFFRLGKSEFSITEILGKDEEKPAKGQRKIEIVFDEGSLGMLTKFRNMNKRQRLKCLISLILLRKTKIRFSSFKALLNLARKGLAVIGSI
jgi:ribosomal protein S18 acetylase RimI-like enzyme